MKESKKTKRRSPKRSIVILGCSFMILLVLSIYAVDVFVWKNPPTKALPKVILVLLPLVAALYPLTVTYCKNAAVIKKEYADKIGSAFQSNSRKKRKLISALVDYATDRYADCVEKLGKLSKAAETAEERRVILYFTALCYKKSGMADEAAGLYRKILEESPDYVPALNNLSVFYYEKHHYLQAIDYAKEALKQDRDNPLTYLNLANSYAKIFSLEKAKNYALRALELEKALYHIPTVLSMIFAAEGDTLSAKQYAELAVSLGQNADGLARAAQSFKEDYKRNQEMQAKVDHWTQKTAVPAIHFTLDGQFEKSVIGGKLNEPAPISASGKTMRLLAAIFCSELPKNDFLPSKGVLRFYITPDDYCGASFEDLNELNLQKEFRVLFDEDESAFSSSAYYGSEDEYFPVSGSFRPRFTLEKDCMTACDFRFHKTVEKLLSEDENRAEAAAYYEDEDFQERISFAEHKLGGFPYFTQEDPRGYNPNYGKYDTLLFQLDSEYSGKHDKIMFGDCGVCNFFIPSEKLKKHDFSDILYTWDCG